jgi:leucine dehydrogenase
MIETLLSEWDGEELIVRHDRPTGAWILIAIHSSRLGPPTGGTRMKPYTNFEEAVRDALRLAKGMTYKFAVPGFPRGGGKAVIYLPKDFPDESRPDLLRRHGELIHQLSGLFYTGPDVGTSPDDMDVIAETGHPYVFCRTPARGGFGAPGPMTSLGVFTGIKAACQHVFGDASLKGRSILVQGLGDVGGTLIEHLQGTEAEILFSEVNEELIKHHRDELGLQYIPSEKVYDTKCDVFSPCALGGILNTDTIPRLKCKIIVGGANNQLATSEDADRLVSKGILYAPDYVVNIGGAMAITGIESMGWSQAEAEENVAESVRNALKRIFEIVAQENITSEAAATRIAEEHFSS